VRSTAQVTAVVTLDELRRGAGAGWIDGADEPVSDLTIAQLLCANGRSLVVMGDHGEPLYLYRVDGISPTSRCTPCPYATADVSGRAATSSPLGATGTTSRSSRPTTAPRTSTTGQMLSATTFRWDIIRSGVVGTSSTHAPVACWTTDWDPLSKFHVSQIETYVRGLYETEHWNHKVDDVNNLSRLLALRAVDLLLGTDDTTSISVEITDGEADRGIDAVGVDPNAKVVVFVQSKWRRDGSGSMALGDVLKFLQGVRSLLGMKVEDEPVHASEEMKTLIQTILKTPGARIRLVTVSTAADPLAKEVEQPILELLASLNDLENTEPMASHRHLSQADLFNSISEAARPAVDLELQMLDWGRASEPQKMYYGRVSASEIAGWFQTHGADLFAENIRVVIPRSDINDGILATIRSEPENFTYYNNGLTVLAQSIELGPGGALNKDVGYFRLKAASIVNGAQTVSTLGSVLGSDAEANLGNAYVIVRCIEVPAGEEKLGQRVTASRGLRIRKMKSLVKISLSSTSNSIVSRGNCRSSDSSTFCGPLKFRSPRTNRKSST